MHCILSLPGRHPRPQVTMVCKDGICECPEVGPPILAAVMRLTACLRPPPVSLPSAKAKDAARPSVSCAIWHALNYDEATLSGAPTCLQGTQLCMDSKGVASCTNTYTSDLHWCAAGSKSTCPSWGGARTLARCHHPKLKCHA